MSQQSNNCAIAVIGIDIGRNSLRAELPGILGDANRRDLAIAHSRRSVSRLAPRGWMRASRAQRAPTRGRIH
jgi:hypothetical protein